MRISAVFLTIFPKCAKNKPSTYLSLGFKTSTFLLAGVGNATVEEGSSKSSNQPGPAGGCQQPSGAGASLPAFRSRTDSVIEYTPPSVGEAAGSTFYINKNGNVDYVVLLKVSLRFIGGRFKS